MYVMGLCTIYAEGKREGLVVIGHDREQLDINVVLTLSYKYWVPI